MMLNILGFRIAGQINRRKTKPLHRQTEALCSAENTALHLRRVAKTEKQQKKKKGSIMVAYLTTLVRIVVLVGHFCCTDFWRHPYINLKVLTIQESVNVRNLNNKSDQHKTFECYSAYGGKISAAMKIFSTSSERMMSRLVRFRFTSSFFSSLDGFSFTAESRKQSK